MSLTPLLPSSALADPVSFFLTLNSYDLGRDVFTGNATMSNGTISPITNRTFSATAEFLSGYLPPNGSTEGINHGIPTDGQIAVLTVRVTNDPAVAKASGTR